MRKYILTLIFGLTAVALAHGADTAPDSLALSKDSTLAELNVKDNFLPVTRRIDRGINAITYVYKKEIALGLDVSYGALSSDDTNFMLFIDDFNFKGSVFTINPSVGYFVKDNLCIGARVGYSKIYGHLGNVSLDLGSEDLNLSLSDIILRNNTTNMGVFARSYAGIDAKGVFGLFAELELSYKLGNSTFSYGTSSGVNATHSNSSQLRLGISAGLSVFIMPRMCCSLSFGLGGISYNRIRQHDDTGAGTGGRTATSMNWKLNLLDIGIGFNVHL